MSAYSKFSARGPGKASATPARRAAGKPGKPAKKAPGRAASGTRASALAAELAAGCAQLGLALDATQREQLLAYLDLLHKWNAVYNLTAIRTLPRMLVEHLFDSLAVLRPLAQRLPTAASGSAAPCIVDVGSGAGLPGIPLAIAWPQAQVHLVEPVGKKAAFLRQCVGALGLGGVQVHDTRVEDLRLPRPPDLIICRAFASLADFLASSAHLADGGTLMCAMKGTAGGDEIAAVRAPWSTPEVIALVIPELDAARHLVLVRHTAASNAQRDDDESTGAPGAPSVRYGA